MSMITIRIQRKNDKEPCFPDLNGSRMVQGVVDRAAILEGGMESGKTSLMFSGVSKVKTPDGFVDVLIALEISASQFEALAGALRGAEIRFKEEPI